jgi:hypothetical protein
VSVAVILVVVFGIVAAVLAQLAYASSRAGDTPDAYSMEDRGTPDFGAGEIREHGQRDRARERANALQSSTTAWLVATSLLSLAAANPTPVTWAVGAVGAMIALMASLLSFIRWRSRDQAIEDEAEYGAFYVQNKILGPAGAADAFEQQHPEIVRRRKRRIGKKAQLSSAPRA